MDVEIRKRKRARTTSYIAYRNFSEVYCLQSMALCCSRALRQLSTQLFVAQVLSLFYAHGVAAGFLKLRSSRRTRNSERFIIQPFPMVSWSPAMPGSQVCCMGRLQRSLEAVNTNSRETTRRLRMNAITMCADMHKLPRVSVIGSEGAFVMNCDSTAFFTACC